MFHHYSCWLRLLVQWWMHIEWAEHHQLCEFIHEGFDNYPHWGPQWLLWWQAEQHWMPHNSRSTGTIGNIISSNWHWGPKEVLPLFTPQAFWDRLPLIPVQRRNFLFNWFLGGISYHLFHYPLLLIGSRDWFLLVFKANHFDMCLTIGFIYNTKPITLYWSPAGAVFHVTSPSSGIPGLIRHICSLPYRHRNVKSPIVFKRQTHILPPSIAK